MVLNLKAVAGVLGALLFALGVSLLAPMAVALFYGEPQWWGFGTVAVGSLLVGGGCWMLFKPDSELRTRDGFAIVALAWLVLSLVGALPFLITGVLTEYSDAFFETMSGFTTTGATILGGADTPAIEEIPNAFLFWRSLTHWMGGMGIIVLTLAVLPLLGIGGMQLFKAEVPGPQTDKLTPRVTETAKRLWAIYVGLTVIEIFLLLPAMSPFDAVNHAFATMATGGFSTENGSVGQYGSAYIDWVIIVFMVLAGINFTMHYLMLHRQFTPIWRNEEFRVYIAILLGATAILTVALWKPANPVIPDAVTLNGEVVEQEITALGEDGVAVDEAVTSNEGRAGSEEMGGGAEVRERDVRGRRIVRYDSFWTSLRYSAFQAAAITTTTGFGTADYELWPPLAISVIFALFFVGGMAGSTGGGVKVVRVLLILKNSFREFKKLIHPQAVIPVRLNHRVVSDSIMQNVLSFIVLYIGLIGLGTLLLGFLGLDLMSAVGAALSSVGNVGPAFGTFGPTEN
ncbi:MAG: potassium transporter TrkG, partial [Rubricoccaceae bacterium]|nr:potassium transporter TrkG [Rubricoccaceae bacterium]